MAFSHDSLSMAVFCDFENVALGVRDANYDKFDIKPVLERLLLKGSIVVKKAYCDWERYKSFKATMHEANFEMIEIPHVRQSGKNSADIRMVVDALDLCYTKSHVNTFVIISGDSDFSPLVSKLRENAKTVIGVGVKQSSSDLLIANCDEFIFYDDLARERERQKQARRAAQPQQQPKRSSDRSDEQNRKREEQEARKTEAIELVVETFEALIAERGDSGKIWASLLKDTLKRRKPDFNETYYGFRSFGNLIEEAKARGLLEFGRDEKSGAYVYRSSAVAPQQDVMVAQDTDTQSVEPGDDAAGTDARGDARGRERGGRGRGGRRGRGEHDQVSAAPETGEAFAGAGETVEDVAPQTQGAWWDTGRADAESAEPLSGAAQGGRQESDAVVDEASSAAASPADTGGERPKRARKQPARVAKAAAKAAAAAAAAAGESGPSSAAAPVAERTPAAERTTQATAPAAP
ncbi:NYN domain-containing protein, partial [Zemynaea arenosa]|uniref:NYN domain-containing protein n=1 Tax=Zemynaea arenosa TaxID=2561931 RepID=UPI0014321372